MVAQPKRFGLLVFLALSRPTGFHRRDELLALFWPDHSEERARNALNQALSFLRRSLGADALPSRGADEVGVDQALLTCDAVAFLAAADRGDDEGALARFTGELLPAFHVDDAPAFGAWLDQERLAMRDRAVACAKQLSARAESRGDITSAIELTVRAVALSPCDEVLARQLVLLHHRSGNPGRAIQAFDEYASRIRRELELDPSPELLELVGKIRSPSPHPAAKQLALEVHAPITQSAPAATAVAAVAATPRRWKLAVALTTALAFIIGVRVATRRSHEGTSEFAVVADFATAQADSGIADILTEATRRALSGSQSIGAAPDNRLLTARRRLSIPISARLTIPLARQVALGEGMRTVISGRLESFGGSYALSLRLISASSNQVLKSVAQIGLAPDKILGALDKLTRELRASAGDDHTAIDAQPALLALTSTSLEAMTDYVAARRAPSDSAVKLLQHAVALDTSFAVAIWQLAFRSRRASDTERSALLARAYGHRNGLTEYERLRLEAAYLFSPNGQTPDRGELVKRLREIVAKYPNADDVAQLGLFYWDRRELAAAESAFTRAIELDSNRLAAHVRLIDVLLTRNQVSEARKEVDVLLRRFPGTEVHEATVAYAENRRDRMREIFTARAHNPTDNAVDLYLNNAWLNLLEGRLADWDRDAGTSIAIDSAKSRLLVLKANYWTRRRRDESLRMLDDLLVRDSAQRRCPDAAILYAQLGRPDVASALLRAFDSASSNEHRHVFGAVGRQSVIGWIRLAEKKPREAIAEFKGDQLVADGFTNSTPIEADAEIGLAYTRAGLLDSAIASYEHYLNTPYADRFNDDAVKLTWVLEHVAALYDGKQRRNEARAAYARLVDLWRDADPELQPRVVHAQRRIAALSR